MPQKDTKPLFEDAPPRDLAFPPEEPLRADEARLAVPITLCEILTFLVNWYRTYPVAFRCASNNLTTNLAKQIIHYHREAGHKGGVGNSILCKMIGKAMGKCGLHTYSNIAETGDPKDGPWTLGKHAKHNTKNHWGPWDHQKLTLTGFRHDGKSSHGLTDNVPFASLAEGVQRFPSINRGDGSNLTLCVQYAVANPLENLQFPRDLKSLTDRLGRLPVVAENYDLALVARWDKQKGAPSPPDPVIVRQPQASAALLVTPSEAPASSSFVSRSAAVGSCGTSRSSRAQSTQRTQRPRRAQEPFTHVQGHMVTPPLHQQQLQNDEVQNGYLFTDAGRQVRHNGMVTPLVRKRKQDAVADLFALPTKKYHYEAVPTGGGVDVDPGMAPWWPSPALITKKYRYEAVPTGGGVDVDPGMAPWWPSPSPAASPFGHALVPSSHYQAPIAHDPSISMASHPFSPTTTTAAHTETCGQFIDLHSFDIWLASLTPSPMPPSEDLDTFLARYFAEDQSDSSADPSLLSAPRASPSPEAAGVNMDEFFDFAKYYA